MFNKIGLIAALIYGLWSLNEWVKARDKARKLQQEVECEFEKQSRKESASPEKLTLPKQELALAVTHTPAGTSIAIPFIPNYFEIAGILCGWFMIGLSVYGIIVVLIKHSFLSFIEMALAIFLALLIGWTLLQVGRRVVRVDLQKDAVILVVRFGGLLLRKFKFPHHPEMEIEGLHKEPAISIYSALNKFEEQLTMPKEQESQDYMLTIIQPRVWFLPWRKTFLLSSNLRQGSWIVSALKSWVRRKTDAELLADRMETG